MTPTRSIPEQQQGIGCHNRTPAQALAEAGVVLLHVKPALLGGALLDGVLFGVGMALLGYRPETSVAACGEGRREAMVGALGMLVGAGVYVAAYPVLQPIIRGLGDWGKVTLAATQHLELTLEGHSHGCHAT